MMFMTKFFLFVSVLFVCFGLSYGDEALEHQTVASVNGDKITSAQVDSEVNRLIPRTFFHQSVDEKKMATLREQALNSLIEKELKIQDALRLGMKVKKKTIKKELEKAIAAYPNREAFEQRLKASGLTLEDARGEIKRRQLAELAYQAQVIDKVKIEEEDVSNYYEKNKRDFILPAQLHLRNILLKIPPLATDFDRKGISDRADAIAKKLHEGLPFKDAVEKYSEGADKDKGGDMGWVHKGGILAEIEQELVKLKPGEFAGSFKTFKGYYIFLVEDIRPERQLPLEEVRSKLTAKLKAEAVEAGAKAWMERLKKQGEIIIYDESPSKQSDSASTP